MLDFFRVIASDCGRAHIVYQALFIKVQICLVLLPQVALKQDLADAIATCEELDQTVTDLTEALNAKVKNTRCLTLSEVLVTIV